MLACTAGGSRAQQNGATASPQAGRSTLDGVYAEAQAARGRNSYALRCRSCHTPGDHSATIKTRWSGRPLSDLFVYIGDNMPKNDPGILGSRDITEILAFLLLTAGLPAGPAALPSDSVDLEKIRFDTLATKGAKP